MALGFNLQYEGVYAPNISNFQTSSLIYDAGIFNWQNDPNDTGDADQYNWVIEYGSHNFALGYGKQVVIPSGTFVGYLNSLLPMTNYDFYGYADAGSGSIGTPIMLNYMTPAVPVGADFELNVLKILDEMSFEQGASVVGNVFKYNSTNNKATLTISTGSVLFGYADFVDGQKFTISQASLLSSQTIVNNTLSASNKLTSSLLQVASTTSLNSTLSSNQATLNTSSATTLTGANATINATQSFANSALINSNVSLANITAINEVKVNSDVNINGSATYLSGGGIISVATKLQGIDASLSNRKSTINSNYAASRYCTTANFDINGNVVFDLQSNNFLYQDVSYLAIDIMTKANGYSDYKNELLSYKITNNNGYAKIEVSSPVMGQTDSCRLIIVNNKTSLL